MAQTVRTKPLPGTGGKGREPSEWLHDLTPTVSDEAMFDDAGHVQPLNVWPTEATPDTERPRLHLVRIDRDSSEPAS